MTGEAKNKKSLDKCRNEVESLKEQLAVCRKTIETDRSGLNAGLKLAFSNEALQRQVALLTEEKEQGQSGASATGRSPA